MEVNRKVKKKKKRKETRLSEPNRPCQLRASFYMRAFYKSQPLLALHSASRQGLPSKEG